MKYWGFIKSIPDIKDYFFVSNFLILPLYFILSLGFLFPISNPFGVYSYSNSDVLRLLTTLFIVSSVLFIIISVQPPKYNLSIKLFIGIISGLFYTFSIYSLYVTLFSIPNIISFIIFIVVFIVAFNGAEEHNAFFSKKDIIHPLMISLLIALYLLLSNIIKFPYYQFGIIPMLIIEYYIYSGFIKRGAFQLSGIFSYFGLHVSNLFLGLLLPLLLALFAASVFWGGYNLINTLAIYFINFIYNSIFDNILKGINAINHRHIIFIIIISTPLLLLKIVLFLIEKKKT